VGVLQHHRWSDAGALQAEPHGHGDAAHDAEHAYGTKKVQGPREVLEQEAYGDQDRKRPARWREIPVMRNARSRFTFLDGHFIIKRHTRTPAPEINGAALRIVELGLGFRADRLKRRAEVVNIGRLSLPSSSWHRRTGCRRSQKLSRDSWASH